MIMASYYSLTILYRSCDDLKNFGQVAARIGVRCTKNNLDVSQQDFAINFKFAIAESAVVLAQGSLHDVHKKPVEEQLSQVHKRAPDQATSQYGGASFAKESWMVQI